MRRSKNEGGYVPSTFQKLGQLCAETPVGGHLDQLTNYCYLKKGHRKYCCQLSCSIWLPFDQLSCKFENIEGHDTPTTPVGTSLDFGKVPLFMYLGCSP